MSESTEIEWTNTVLADGTVVKGATWNAVVGCSQVSEGCRHCYAETLDRRFRQKQEGKPYRAWTHPNAAYNVRVFPDRLELPLRWRRPRRIFVNSRSDMFHEAIPTDFRERMWAVMKQADRHVFQILTKRPENILGMLPSDWGSGYPNVWLGVSGETYATADVRAAYLDEVPAKVRFLSAEPWLETEVKSPTAYEALVLGSYDWVIVGGESGPHCRPMDLDSAEALIEGAHAAGAKVFLKQLGGHPDKRSHEKAVLACRRWEEYPA
jgi:protein gp37